MTQRVPRLYQGLDYDHGNDHAERAIETPARGLGVQMTTEQYRRSTRLLWIPPQKLVAHRIYPMHQPQCFPPLAQQSSCFRIFLRGRESVNASSGCGADRREGFQ